MKNDTGSNNIGSAIKDYIARNGLSPSKFAEKCELSKSLIYALLNGTYTGSLCKNNIEKIAYGMDLSYSELNYLIEEYHSNVMNNEKNSDEIIIHKNSKLYELFKDIHNFNDEKIEILHNVAVNLK